MEHGLLWRLYTTNTNFLALNNNYSTIKLQKALSFLERAFLVDILHKLGYKVKSTNKNSGRPVPLFVDKNRSIDTPLTLPRQPGRAERTMLLSFFNSDSPLPSNWEGLTPTIVLFNIRKRCFPLIHWPLRCSLLPVIVIQLMEMK